MIIRLISRYLVFIVERTLKAINFMSELFELKQFGVRDNSKVVAVVITDGRSNDSPLVRSGQERLKKIVDVVIAVGVNMKKEVILENYLKTKIIHKL